MKTIPAIAFLCIVATLSVEARAETTSDSRVSARTGAFERSLAPREIVGAKSAQHIADIIPPGEAISYEVYVPGNYSPDKPAGVFVYISPTYSGEMPDTWDSVLAEHNLIWIGANRSGNRQRVSRRKVYALLAPSVIAGDYEVDFSRVYVSGFSGGGKTASRVAVDYARLFTGALFICGVDFWDVDEPQYIDSIRNNRYVFLTGTYDQALEPTRDVFEQFEGAGIQNIKLMVIRDMPHRTPRRLDFDAAIRFLDDAPEAAGGAR